VASLTASLHDKEEEAAVLAGLQRNIADIKEIANNVLPPAPGGGADDESFAALKRIGAVSIHSGTPDYWHVFGRCSKDGLTLPILGQNPAKTTQSFVANLTNAFNV